MMKKRELRWYTGLTLGLCCLFLMMLCAVAAAEVEVNEANFPDDNFRKFILEEYAGGDQVLTDAEIAKVTSMYCSAMEIYDMQGIEYFTAMTSLSCAVNYLTSLDVSGCTALKKLDCSYNALLQQPVVGSVKLTELDCGGNRLIKSMDLSAYPALTKLNCSLNALTSLDVSMCPALKDLDCCDNRIATLKTVKSLTALWCSGNQLNRLDVSGCPELKQLLCTENSLSTLDVTKNTKLHLLACEDNKIRRLDVSGCPKLMKVIANNKVQKDKKTYWWRKGETFLRMNLDTKFIHSVTGVSLNKTKATLTRTSKEHHPTLTLKATISPACSANKSVTWSSSNPKVAKVDEKGKVTALKVGTTKITCTAKDGKNVYAICRITVVDRKVTKIILNKKKASMVKGDTLQLRVKSILPKDAVNRKVQWTSSNEKIAKVDQKGKVTALKKGKVTITCKATDGSKVKATCKITIE